MVSSNQDIPQVSDIHMDHRRGRCPCDRILRHAAGQPNHGIGRKNHDSRRTAVDIHASPQDAFVAMKPLATLYGLAEAAKRPQLPQWAGHLIDYAGNGHLEQGLREALRTTLEQSTRRHR